VVAVDLLGRGTRPHDLTAVTLEDAAAAAATDVRAVTSGPWAVVAHSAGSIVAPHLVAQLGDVSALVMVAGMCAPEGERAIDIVDPERRLGFEEQRVPMLEKYRGYTFVGADEADPPGPLLALRDRRAVQRLDSIVLMYQTVSWAGVPPATTRVWVRCHRDQIQDAPMQDRLIAASGASEVRTLDTGHTPAAEDPAALAALIAELAV
jgi:pimeloyl-ACP methyl ester carboxylesterase